MLWACIFDTTSSIPIAIEIIMKPNSNKFNAGNIELTIKSNRKFANNNIIK